MSDLKKREVQQLRSVFARHQEYNDLDLIAKGEVDGENLEVIMTASGRAAILVPCDGEGNCVRIIVNNSILKRWKFEAQDAARIMKRIGSGEYRISAKNHRHR